jgi:hypothetical protein
MADEPTPQPLDYHRGDPNRIKVAESPEAKQWRYLRAWFRVGLFVVVAPVVFYFAKNVILFGRLTPLRPADFVEQTQRLGVPVVRAIKEYQRDTGKFPNDVQDLQPKYLPQNLGFECEIESARVIVWGRLNHRITYDFTPGAEGWSVDGPFTSGPILLPPVTIDATTQPSK